MFFKIYKYIYIHTHVPAIVPLNIVNDITYVVNGLVLKLNILRSIPGSHAYYVTSVKLLTFPYTGLLKHKIWSVVKQRTHLSFGGHWPSASPEDMQFLRMCKLWT